MANIDANRLLGITRIKTVFRTELGDEKSGFGTGFWVLLSSNDCVLVTNRHNVDPKLYLGANTAYELARVEIQLREARDGNPTANVKFFELAEPRKQILFSNEADCAIIKMRFRVPTEPFKIVAAFSINDLADDSWLSEEVFITDAASFIGYPSLDGAIWWDERWNFPIARLATISSPPSIAYTNKMVKTADTVLVSGLSFSGSSGSPVIIHGGQVTRPIEHGTSSYYLHPKIIGIMSGHWWEPSGTPTMFKHSGLSYFTRSSSIRLLLQKCASEIANISTASDEP